MQTVLSPYDAFFQGHRAYAWDGRLFTTVADFTQYVAQVNLEWAEGVTIHHTWRPTVAQWQSTTGANNLKGLVRTWRDTNGWNTGPNMVIAPEGIYLASGITAAGIHAGICNHDHIGIEIVGDYDNQGWQEPIKSFVYGAVSALANGLRLTRDDIINKHLVNGHRECNSPKSCPGKAINLTDFRYAIANRLSPAPAYYESLYNHVPVRQGPSRDFPIALNGTAILSKGDRFAVDTVVVGQNVGGIDRWVHRVDQLGFVHLGALKKV